MVHMSQLFFSWRGQGCRSVTFFKKISLWSESLMRTVPLSPTDQYQTLKFAYTSPPDCDLFHFTYQWWKAHSSSYFFSHHYVLQILLLITKQKLSITVVPAVTWQHMWLWMNLRHLPHSQSRCSLGTKCPQWSKKQYYFCITCMLFL